MVDRPRRRGRTLACAAWMVGSPGSAPWSTSSRSCSAPASACWPATACPTGCAASSPTASAWSRCSSRSSPPRRHLAGPGGRSRVGVPVLIVLGGLLIGGIVGALLRIEEPARVARRGGAGLGPAARSQGAARPRRAGALHRGLAHRVPALLRGSADHPRLPLRRARQGHRPAGSSRRSTSSQRSPSRRRSASACCCRRCPSQSSRAG